MSSLPAELAPDEPVGEMLILSWLELGAAWDFLAPAQFRKQLQALEAAFHAAFAPPDVAWSDSYDGSLLLAVGRVAAYRLPPFGGVKVSTALLAEHGSCAAWARHAYVSVVRMPSAEPTVRFRIATDGGDRRFEFEIQGTNVTAAEELT